jgi:hypothetical protein
MNAGWHQNHRMPKHPTPEQRLDWHLEHEVHCACRPMPPGLKKESARGGEPLRRYVRRRP